MTEVEEFLQVSVETQIDLDVSNVIAQKKLLFILVLMLVDQFMAIIMTYMIHVMSFLHTGNLHMMWSIIGWIVRC